MGAIDFEKYFYYDETSKSCIRWKVDRYTGAGYARKIVSNGDEAGTICKIHGYYYIRLDGKGYRAHRIVVYLNNRKFTKDCIIDHIGGIRTNNKIDNLRIVTHTENQRNKKKQKNNTTGVTGVSFRSTTNRYSANWHDCNGIKRSKYFGISKYGDEGAFNLACEYRKFIIEKMNINNAGYTWRHGQ